MKTEFVLFGKNLNMATRARRRWLVAVVYTCLALFVVAWFYNYSNSFYGYAKTLPGWCLILAALPIVAFSSIAGDMRAHGDERETHRRQHAYCIAYRFLGSVLAAALIAAYFRGPNPITPLMFPALQAILYELPYALLMAAGILYITLPQTILLWTEPDMEQQ
jgi:hypothetical protein